MSLDKNVAGLRPDSTDMLLLSLQGDPEVYSPEASTTWGYIVTFTRIARGIYREETSYGHFAFSIKGSSHTFPVQDLGTETWGSAQVGDRVGCQLGRQFGPELLPH